MTERNSKLPPEFREAAIQIPGLSVRDHVHLAELTTFAVGGPVDLLLEPSSLDALAAVLHLLHSYNLDFAVLGRGSNILASDAGLRGPLIRLAENFAQAQVQKDRIVALAGVPLFQISALAARHSLSGAEFLVGIPGSLGGAICMNAGAYDYCMADIVESARLMDKNGEIKEFSVEELDFAYRHSYLSTHKMLVAEVSLKLVPTECQIIYEKMAELQTRRRHSQPLEEASAGSSFKRPKGAYAAKLIAEAGLKGYRQGQCGVSAKHAGFIVNYGGASAQEIRALFREVQERVEAKSGFCLEPEVKLLGEW